MAQGDAATAAAVERLRPRLFGIAYRMLGGVADAEDAVQEAFLRWEQARARGEAIAVPEGWLVSVVTRRCIDELRSARARREHYIGP
jgi:RNA polymerase sigma-70 factor (ECF subfamily)